MTLNIYIYIYINDIHFNDQFVVLLLIIICLDILQRLRQKHKVQRKHRLTKCLIIHII